MLKALSTRLLQHVIAQNSWACELLQPFAGKSIEFKVGFISASLVILENGYLAIAGQSNTPDAIVDVAPSLLLRLLAKDESAKRQIKIDGNTQLAAELAKVFTHVRWDYEDDLSRLVGDIPAKKIGDAARNTANSVKTTSANLMEMLSEYWQEEMPVIAKKHHVEAFNEEVDTLRADVARFEKRLAKFAKSLENETNTESVNIQ